MVHLDKRYFPLEEIAERWKVQRRDLVYMAEVGELRISVRIQNVHVERGARAATCDQRTRVCGERMWFTGLLDLTTQDTHLVFRNGEAKVREFHAGSADANISIVAASTAMRVKPEHLVVRLIERDRIEAKHRESGHSVAAGLGFQHSPDYRFVRFGEAVMALGAVQAHIVRILHAAADTHTPWRLGKAVLLETGAASRRMTDVFKSQPNWRTFIVSDERGNYRLRPKPQ